MRASMSWLLLGGMVGALSCESAERRRGSFLAECTFNDECNAPLLCAARRCRVECRSDRDCSNGWRCLSAGLPSRYVCYPPEQYDTGCVYSADCRQSWVCGDRVCRPQCRHDYDCAVLRPGLRCLRDLGVCADHPFLSDAGTLPDVDINDPDGAFTVPPPDVPPAAVDAPVADAPVADASDVPPAVDVPAPPVDAGDPYACATRTGACAPGPGCGVTAVGIGLSVRCAVLAGGSVRCWGAGALGNGAVGTCTVPGLVAGLVDADVVGVGGTYACVRRLLGAGVQCWGESNVGELGLAVAPRTRVLTPTANSAMDGALAVGTAHACTLGAGGAVSCWGDNVAGQFGYGGEGGPGLLAYWTTPRTFSLPARALALGNSHTCAVGIDGAPRCWGSNLDGALGDGTTTNHPSPAAVTGLVAVEQVVAGQGHSCARLADGSVRCWGYNAYGQLGDGSMAQRTTPVTPAVTTVAELAAGRFGTCARRADGSVWCWGDGSVAGLGDGVGMTPTPTAVPGVSGATRLFGGGAGFCALVGADADLRCWGAYPGRAGVDAARSPVEVTW
jgi:hypothetical protein